MLSATSNSPALRPAQRRSPCPDLEARVTLMDKNNKLLTHLGEDDSNTWGKLRKEPRDKFIPGKFVCPHSACFDKDGNIFVVEWVEVGRVTKLKPCLRSLSAGPARTTAEFLVHGNAEMALETEHSRSTATGCLGRPGSLQRPCQRLLYRCRDRWAPAGQMMITYEWSDWRNGTFWWIQSVLSNRNSAAKAFSGRSITI